MAGEMTELALTAVGIAISTGELHELRKLFQMKDAPFLKDRKGNTYLHYACTIYKPHTVNILLATGIDINTQNKNGNTALHVSAMQSECWHVRDLMAAGINPNLKNWEGKTAAELKHKNQYWLTIYNKFLPGIFEAVGQHDTQRIKDLLQCWTKIDCIRNGQTLRQYAAQLKYHDIVWMLDEQRATSDLIQGVLEVDYEKVFEALTKSRFNVNYINKAGTMQHILQHAIYLQDRLLINLLCGAGADVNTLVTINNYYKGPLYFEALQYHIPEDIMWKLLKSGADVNLKDERGRNAMIFAFDRNGCIPLSVINYLMKNGASITDRDETGVNIRDVARLTRRKDIVDFIDTYYLKLVRKSDIENLKKLVLDGYDSIMIQHNSRDTFIYASGNETDDVVKFIEWLPGFEKHVKKLHNIIINSGSMDEVKKLFRSCDSQGFLVNTKDKGGRSSVSLAVLYNRSDILDYILQITDVNVNNQDNCKRTAYHYACYLGSEGEEIRQILIKQNMNTDILDNVGKRGEDYLNRNKSDWIVNKRKMMYGLELELACVDAYEELRKIIRSKKYGIQQFCEKLKTLHIPIGSFSMLLSPVVPDFKDLLFLAVDYNKSDIAIKLVDLGTNLDRREKYLIKNKESCEIVEEWMTVDDRASYLQLKELGDMLAYKKSQQKQYKTSAFQPEDYNQIVKVLTHKMENINLNPWCMY